MESVTKMKQSKVSMSNDVLDIRSNEKGLSLLGLIVGLGIFSTSLYAMSNMTSNSLKVISQETIEADLSYARSEVAKASCNSTHEMLIAAGMDCSKPRTQNIVLLGSYSQKTPRKYMNNKVGKFNVISTRVSCKNNKVEYEHALLDSKNRFVARNSMDIKASWQPLFKQRNLHLKPFKKFPCN